MTDDANEPTRMIPEGWRITGVGRDTERGSGERTRFTVCLLNPDVTTPVVRATGDSPEEALAAAIQLLSP